MQSQSMKRKYIQLLGKESSCQLLVSSLETLWLTLLWMVLHQSGLHQSRHLGLGSIVLPQGHAWLLHLTDAYNIYKKTCWTRKANGVSSSPKDFRVKTQKRWRSSLNQADTWNSDHISHANQKSTSKQKLRSNQASKQKWEAGEMAQQLVH